MAVHSTFFGVTKLTGQDSENFRRQATYARPNAKAIAAQKRGKALLRKANAHGVVKVKLKKI